MEENNVIMNEVPINPEPAVPVMETEAPKFVMAPVPQPPVMPIPTMPNNNPKLNGMDYAVGGFAIIGAGATIYFAVKGGIWAYKKIKATVEAKKAQQAAPAEEPVKEEAPAEAE